MLQKYKDLLGQVNEAHSSRDSLVTNSKVLIIDGMNVFMRSFSVVPTTNINGDHIGGLTGFLTSLGRVIEIHRPTRIICVFDGPGGSVRRRKLFKPYKANRAAKGRYNRSYDFLDGDQEDRSKQDQLIRLATYLQNFPITTTIIENIEADDAIAYMAMNLQRDKSDDIVIMSSDKDYLQLVSDKISIWDPRKRKLMTPKGVQEDHEIPAHNFLLWRMVQGDMSDNIPGVKGIGLKKLKTCFPMIDGEDPVTMNQLIEYAETKCQAKKPLQAYQLIRDSRAVLERNYDLMQLHEVDIHATAKIQVADALRRPIPRLTTFPLIKMCMEDQLHSAIPNFEGWLQNYFNPVDMFAKQFNDALGD